VGSASFTLKSPKRETLLRVCGLIDLAASLVLILLGLGLLLTPGWGFGIATVFAGIATLWAGSVMTWGRVYVNSNRLLTMTNRPHRATRDHIASIDVCRSDLGKLKQVLPVVRLKDGKSFKLPPLCVSPVVGYTRQTPEQQALMMSQQGNYVREIRSMLGVGGSDYAGD